MINLPKLSYRNALSQIPIPVREKSRKWASTIATLFLTTFFIAFAIRPTVITIAELLAEIRAREELNQKLQEKIEQIMVAQKLYNQIYPRLYLLDQALPTNPKFAYFSQTLESNRIEANLNLETLNYSSIVLTEMADTKTEEKNQEFVFTTGLSGRYHDLKSFLENLFNQRRIIYINNLKIDQKQNNQQGEQAQADILPLTITIDGEAFYLGSE